LSANTSRLERSVTDEEHPQDRASDPSRTPGQGLSKEDAVFRLWEGHWRYMRNERTVRPVSDSDRQDHSCGQFPFVAFLGCSDSRVSPELIFDQAQGDIFVVRVAGNITGPSVAASIEYAVEVLGVRLIFILGHEQCGAVMVATDHPDLSGPIGALVREILPAVEEARTQPGCLLDNSVIANVRRSVHRLREESAAIAHRIRCGDVRIVGAVYGLQSGDISVVETLG
jgi:carbonic anhydrase